ncbi:MAG: type II toxin-antitoxin system VapC family toxin [Ignavibacteriaceae bacterium]
MRILLDTNIILDLLLDRAPFSDAAAKLFSLIERKDIAGFICATTVTTISYFLQKSLGKAESREILGNILNVFEIAEVNKNILLLAQKSGFNDFEDAVIYEAAKVNKIKAIITRNKNDFSNSKIVVSEAGEFLDSLLN